MKSLMDQVRDLRDTALILREQADSLEQLALFFGATIPAEQPKPAAVPLPQPVVMPPQVKRKSPDTGSRPLSPDEKQAIKKDWNSLGEHLRTKENRIALARKYQCSPVQIFALNRLPGHYRKMTARRNEIRSQAQPQTT